MAPQHTSEAGEYKYLFFLVRLSQPLAGACAFYFFAFTGWLLGTPQIQPSTQVLLLRVGRVDDSQFCSVRGHDPE